ncbi:hypothetical protein NLG97_g1893 [Lecanicillium saksenae]|uniref:Uncharacterized protein n=1 Tax=Lecanicillium saksenae TaxID=468837 RepID=A0ACC1R5W9_9HYPO|nr:hypothetical protein NLG97_g1893 [Lecanicillium saksenae]
MRLVDVIDSNAAPYAALSYSWGDAVTTKTTCRNLTDMKRQITMSSLQATTVDAVTLTRELGLRYLWVDALCIVQDSAQDWETESAKMASIYANAVITIASVSSKSAGVPFLRHENSKEATEHHQRLFSQTVQTPTGPTVIKARLVQQSGIHWRWRSDSDERAPKEPWAQRGWTLQEQILSSRLLMISSTEMQWVCKQAEACECLSTLNRGRQFGHTPLAQLTDMGETFRFWHKLLETYSNRTLTEGRDKLPAISGIAELVQRKTNSRYVAGLWENNIHLDLLWHKTGDTTTALGSDPQAPSFSWASVDGEVDYYCFRNGRLPYRPCIKVLSMEARSSTQAPLGRVTGGSLTLSGPLVSGRITKYSGSGWAELTIANQVLEFIPDSHLGYVLRDFVDKTERVACRRLRGQQGVEPMQAQESDPGSISAFSPGIICWLLKLGQFEASRCEDEEWAAEIMVLGMAVSEPGCYQRLGMMSGINAELDSLFGERNNPIVKIV